MAVHADRAIPKDVSWGGNEQALTVLLTSLHWNLGQTVCTAQRGKPQHTERWGGFSRLRRGQLCKANLAGHREERKGDHGVDTLHKRV